MSDLILYINGQNAREKWGIVATPNTLSALLAPPALKEFVSNSSRLEHGTRYDISNPRLAERIINLEILLTASTITLFYSRKTSFESELKKGYCNISTSDQPDVVYHFIQPSCTQFTQFNRGIATFSLKMIEPNPDNRTA